MKTIDHASLPALSVIVLCPQEQIAHVRQCLEMLARQTWRAFEVIVMEQGGQNARFTCQAFVAGLNLRYFASPRAGRLAQSFQFAVNQAAHDGLVCITAATLLNPAALESYAQALSEARLQFGYIGSGQKAFEPDSGDAWAPSLWFPHTQVAYLDQRFLAFRRDGLLASPYLLAYPFHDAVPSNFALSRRLLERLGGFEAGLGSWHEACKDFALRAGLAGCGFDFTIGAWAEQLLGEKPAEPPGPALRLPEQLVPVRTPTRLLDESPAAARLLGHLFQDYYPRAQGSEPEQSQLLQHSQIMLAHRPEARQPGYQLTRYEPGQLPGFLIIGTQKGGTTSLFNYLGQHPALSPALLKEVHFFDRDENFHQGKAWYSRQFLGEAGRIGFEATPEYLDREDCAVRIAGCLPGARLIVLLRDPIERAFSAWNMYRHQLPHSLYFEPRSFEVMIAQELAGQIYRGYLERGHYALHLRRFLKYFDRSRLLLLDFEELRGQPERLLQRCCDFLELPALELAVSPRPYNQGQYGEALPAALRSQLEAYFAPFNQQLRQEWGLDFAWLAR